MTSALTLDNSGETNFADKLATIADTLLAWQGPIVLVTHVDPDGDALGSTLALKRALDAEGKTTSLPIDPPRFLQFLARPGDLSAELESLPENCLLLVLDVAHESRALGAPLEGASFLVNIDHHGTNSRFGDLSCVEPSYAATAQIVKDLIDAMGTTWTRDIATPCLAGILTDTGFLRFGNTTPQVLTAVSELIAEGIDYSALTEQLSYRHPDYFKMLGKVMSTVEFPLDGLVAMARVTREMREELGPSDDDSDDYVGIIRYAEGAKVAILLKERDHGTKLSVRSRDGISAQAICLALGGGGHVAAAGATLTVGLEEARALVLEATQRELESKGAL